jgi:hypothetical protein
MTGSPTFLELDRGLFHPALHVQAESGETGTLLTGGAVLLSPSSTTTFTNVLFTNNAADEGEGSQCNSESWTSQGVLLDILKKVRLLVFASLYLLGPPRTEYTRFSPRDPRRKCAVLMIVYLRWWEVLKSALGGLPPLQVEFCHLKTFGKTYRNASHGQSGKLSVVTCLGSERCPVACARGLVCLKTWCCPSCWLNADTR